MSAAEDASEVGEFDPRLIDAYLESFPPSADSQLNIWLLESCAFEGTSAQLQRVLDLVEEFPVEDHDFALARIARHLSEKPERSADRVAVIETMSSIKNSERRAEALDDALAWHESDPAIIEAVVDQLLDLEPGAVGQVLRALPKQLPASATDKLIDRTQNTSDFGKKRHLVSSIGELELDDLQRSKLDAMKSALVTPFELIESAINAFDEIDESTEARLVESIKQFDSESARIQLMCELIDKLPPERAFGRAVPLMSTVAHDDSRLKILTRIVAGRADGCWFALFDGLASIEDGHLRVNILETNRDAIPPEYLTRILDTVESIDNDAERVKLLKLFAPRFNIDQVHRALQSLDSFDSSRQRARGHLPLLGAASEPGRAYIADSFFHAVQDLPDLSQSMVLVEAIPTLNDAERKRATELANAMDHQADRSAIIKALN